MEETQQLNEHFSSLPGLSNDGGADRFNGMLTIGDPQSRLNHDGMSSGPHGHSVQSPVTDWNTDEMFGNAQPHTDLREPPNTDFLLEPSQPSIYQPYDFSQTSQSVGYLNDSESGDEEIQSIHNGVSFGDDSHEVGENQAWDHQLSDFSTDSYVDGFAGHSGNFF